MRYFDAHNHLQNYAAPGELAAALAAASAVAMLCCATGPADWDKVLEISASNGTVLPCFGVHPWFCSAATGDWLARLESLLRRAPSCVGEIGLDATRPATGQEEIFRAQLGLAVKLGRPAVIHCVKSWGRLSAILKETRPAAFMLHAYGGPSEMAAEFAALGGYFSFGGELIVPGRVKLRAALKTVPRGRLLFETDAPAPGAAGRSHGPACIIEVVKAAAEILEVPAKELAELSYNNGREFSGGVRTWPR